MNEIVTSASIPSPIDRREPRLDAGAGALLLFMLFLAPLLLASNRPVFWALNGAFATVILSLLAVRLWKSTDRFAYVGRVLFLSALAIILLLAWMAVQAAEWTPRSWRHPLWEIVPGAEGSMSIEPSLTLSTIGWTVTLSIMLAAIVKGSDPKFVRRYLQLVGGTAAAIALFGVVVEAIGIPTLGIVPKTAYLGWLTGTFVNRNAAATFFAFGMIAALALAVAPEARTLQPRRRKSLFRFSVWGRDASLRWLAIAAFLLVAVVLTGSRGGFTGALVSLAVFVAIWVIKMRRLRALDAPTLLVTGTICIIAITILSKAGIFDRPDAESSTQTRISLYREAISAVGDRPFLGHGAGTYAAVQPLYQSSMTPPRFVWNHAHSTYLEAALTLGLPATITVLVLSLFTLVWIVRALARRNPPTPALLVALPVAAMAAVHALVDFSLQMQAVALHFVTFAGLAMGAAVSTRGTPGKNPEPKEEISSRASVKGTSAWLFPRGAASLVSLLALIAFAANLRIVGVELAIPPSLWLSSLRPYVAQPFLPRLALPNWLRDKHWGDPYAIFIHAADCQLLETVAPEFGLRTPVRIKNCLADIDHAIRMAPASGSLWLKKAALLRDHEAPSASLFAALLNSYKTARRSLPLKPVRLALSLAYWNNLPQELQAEVAAEAVTGLDSAIAAIAMEYVRHPGERSAIEKGLAEIAPESVRQAFANEVTIQDDRLRRGVDRIEANRRLASCQADCNATAKLTLDIVGETFSEPPQFRVWADGYPHPPTFVTSAIDLERGEGLAWSDPAALQAESFVFDVSALFSTLEIEFINDDWDQARGLDRNLGVLRVRVDDEDVRLPCFRIPAQYEDDVIQSDGLLLFIRDSAVRLERPCEGEKAP